MEATARGGQRTPGDSSEPAMGRSRATMSGIVCPIRVCKDAVISPTCTWG